MSMNLAFELRTNKHATVDFPFQTPTTLTWAVIKEPSVDKRIAMVRAELESRTWPKEDVERVMKKVEALMRDPELRLIVV